MYKEIPIAEVTDTRPLQQLNADVLVVGGGASGLAAAVTAARNGCSVILVERYGFCGGGAVAGLSGTICGLYEANDRPARPKKLVYGFVDDFIRQMELGGGLDQPIRYGKTYTRVHDPLVWREVADSMLNEAGVKIIYHAIVIGVLMEGDRVLGAQINTKEGKLHIYAKVTVDASGDADVMAMAGFPTFMGKNGRVQNPTMIFRLSGVDVSRFLTEYGDDSIMPTSVSEMITKARLRGLNLPRSKIWLFPTPRPGELLCNCTRITGEDQRELNTIHYGDFTEAELEGRRQARTYANFFREHLKGCEASWIADTAIQVGVRQTRQIFGSKRLLNEHVLSGAKSSDAIARSPWPIELHQGDRPKVEWLVEDYYEIPFGCFVPIRGTGILACGRCLSADHEAVASARVTAQCFSYGHAIGHAVALTVNERIETTALKGEDVRALLNKDGAHLD